MSILGLCNEGHFMDNSCMTEAYHPTIYKDHFVGQVKTIYKLDHLKDYYLHNIYREVEADSVTYSIFVSVFDSVYLSMFLYEAM